MSEPKAMDAVDVRWATRQDFLEITISLLAEFAGRLLAWTVIQCVAGAREQQLGSGLRSGLPVAAESMARLQLCALVPAGSSAEI